MKPKPKTLIEVFKEQGLFDEPEEIVVCECHQLIHCPTAWMSQPIQRSLSATLRIDLGDCE